MEKIGKSREIQRIVTRNGGLSIFMKRFLSFTIYK